MTWELAGAWEWKPLGTVLTPVRTQVKPDEIHDDWTYVGLEQTPVTFARALIAHRDRATAYEAVRSRFESWWVRCGAAGPNPASAPRAVAQLAAQGLHKAPVGGSIPPCTTAPWLGWFEHPADARKVGGSSPPGAVPGHGCRFDSRRVPEPK